MRKPGVLPSFGAQKHWYAHFLLHMATVQPEGKEPPSLGSTSVVAPGLWQWGSHHFPRPAMVKFLDGEAAETAKREAAFKGLSEAAAHLWEKDKLLVATIVWACLDAPHGPEGDIKLGRDPAVRHEGTSAERSRSLYTSRRKWDQALREGWEYMSVLWATPEELAEAIKLRTVDEDALLWARSKGYVK